jgi:hypothetical protein
MPPGPIGLLLRGKRPMLVPHAKSERKIKFSRVGDEWRGRQFFAENC